MAQVTQSATESAAAAAAWGGGGGVEEEESLTSFLFACAYIRQGGIAKQVGSFLLSLVLECVRERSRARAHSLFHLGSLSPSLSFSLLLFHALARSLGLSS